MQDVYKLLFTLQHLTIKAVVVLIYTRSQITVTIMLSFVVGGLFIAVAAYGAGVNAQKK